MRNHYFTNQWRKQFLIALGTGCFLCTGLIPVQAATSTSNVNVVQQQTIPVKGVVKDSKTGEPIVGASVTVKGASKTGMMTDVNGEFGFSVNPNATLVISYIGYVSTEVPVRNQRNISVSLSEDNKMLNEVIVVGYGTVKKADLAGSVSVMDNKAFKDQPITQVSQSLQGRIAGVSVENNGVPGGAVKIRVRGAASINRSNDPLYVVDGIVRESGLTGIDPEDIQSIQILKDASSTAIYGSRGANGVILITTKTGKANQKLITFDASIGFSNIYKKYDELNAYEYATALKDIKGTQFSDADMAGYQNGSLGINWQDQMMRTGYTQNYKVTLSNGNDKTQYYISANHVNQTGVVYGFNDKRYQVRANITSDVTPWLHVTADVNLSHNATQAVDASASTDNIMMLTLNYSPTMEMMDANGNYNKDPYNAINYNPKGIVSLQAGKSMSDIVNGMLDLRFKLMPGLTFTTTNGFDYYDGHGYSFSTPRVYLANNGASAGNSNTWRLMLQSSNNLTYTGKWGDHSLTATAVWEASQSENRSLSASAQTLPVESVGYWNLGIGKYQYAGNGYSKWALLSGVGRVLYNYADKYLLTATFRADGSSKFTNKKWGYFPSVAVAWNMGNENFMKKQNIFSNVKLRASYGIVGNQAIGSYSTLGLLSATSSYYGGTSPYSGYWATSLSTPDVTWEKTKQLDLGADFSMLDGRVDVTVDYFNRKTTDALLRKTLPNYDGGGSYWVNSGSVRNTGVDLSITGHILNQKDLSWNSTLNMTFLKNKVLDLAGDSFIEGGNPASGLLGFAVNRTIVGESIGTFYGYDYAGISKTTGENTYYKLENGQRNGDPVTADKITASDRKVLGKSIPDMTFGWNNQLTYKNFDLNFFLTGSFGAKKLNLMRFMMASMVGNSRFITLRDAYYKNFDQVGAGAEYPSLKNNYKVLAESGQWLENASYVRMENITLGYNLSRNITKFADLRFYFSVQNLFTITKYKGMDPASNSFSSTGNYDVDNGIDLGAFPTPRTYTIGVRMNF
jgi:TonB-linked SusC/RagA family outer membrane protein